MIIKLAASSPEAFTRKLLAAETHLRNTPKLFKDLEMLHIGASGVINRTNHVKRFGVASAFKDFDETKSFMRAAGRNAKSKLTNNKDRTAIKFIMSKTNHLPPIE